MTAGLPISMSAAQLKFLLGTSAENLIRLESILRRRQELGSVPEFDAIISAMLGHCDSYRGYYLQYAPTIRKVLSDIPISQIEELGLKTLFRNCINTFLVLHELLLFLPREPIRKEMHFFCAELFWPVYDISDLSVILTSVYNAFEYSLDAAIKSLDVFIMKVPDPNKLGFGHVMELAIIDRDNPLSWPILAHEFGHYLDNKYTISDPLTEHFIDTELHVPSDSREVFRKIFKPLAAELFADLTSYYLLGPVGILPIVNMELNFGMATDEPIPYDGIHPFTSTRLQVITDIAAADHMTLESFGTYIQALKEDEDNKVAKLPPAEQKKRASNRQLATFLAQRLRAAFIDEIEKFNLKRFKSDNFKTSEDLKSSLGQGIPVGCKRQLSDDVVRTRLSEVTNTSSVTELREVFAVFREVPVRVSEVLTAGWISNTGRQARALADAFALGDLDKVFPHLKKSLEDQDKLLMKSIEMISVVMEMVSAPQ